jgi:hypothetical protein
MKTIIFCVVFGPDLRMNELDEVTQFIKEKYELILPENLLQLNTFNTFLFLLS